MLVKLRKALRFIKRNRRVIATSAIVSLATAVIYQSYQLHSAHASVDEAKFIKKTAQREDMCLAKNIYYEAGVESRAGKVAVAQVTLNRVRSGYWGNTICEVVYAKNQFSWTKKKQHAPRGKLWEEAKEVAKNTLYGNARNPAMVTAMFYHTEEVYPPWISEKHKLGQIGSHIFYTGALDANFKVSK